MSAQMPAQQREAAHVCRKRGAHRRLLWTRKLSHPARTNNALKPAVITRVTYAHVSFELPLWFRDAVVWVWHSREHDYRPDALDVEDSAVLVLLILAHLVSARIVVPLSTRVWRRRINPRFTP
jgi:hypothetical protein